MAIERPRSEHEKRELDFEKFFIEDLHEAILNFINVVPGDGQNTLEIPCVYPGLMLGFQPARAEELGFISVNQKTVEDDKQIFAVCLSNEAGDVFAELEMLVDQKTNQPIVALSGNEDKERKEDMTDPAFLSTLLDSSAEALRAQK